MLKLIDSPTLELNNHHDMGRGSNRRKQRQADTERTVSQSHETQLGAS